MMFVLAVCFVITITQGRGFILDTSDGCPVSPPCKCYGTHTIDCSSNQLTTFPELPPVTIAYTVRLDFSHNNLSYIPPHAFQNVSTGNAVHISLHLENNSISDISESAFDGIENTTDLYLQSNQLTKVPTALGRLEKLQRLNLQDNPLIDIDPQIVINFRNTLKDLSFGAGKMTSWPDGINLLHWLEALTVDGIPFTSLPYNAFHGFGDLTRLNLLNTSLEHVPESICHLKHIQQFEFQSRSLSPHYSFQDLCHDPVPTLSSLKLEGNGFSTFPDGLFTTFPMLDKLNLAENKLKYIQFENVNSNNSLKILQLSHNLLRSIPTAIIKFPLLRYLDLSYNDIVSLEHRNILQGIPIYYLNLDGNPIEYIYREAFRNTSTVVLHLSYTDLDTIPVALTILPNLWQLHFHTHSGIDCSCDKMDHLRAWTLSHTKIFGNCEFTNETINNYILHSLPMCPQ